MIVVGDLILDEYLTGYPERISREAPVIILEYKESFYRLGGAANAAINAAKLGAAVTLIGVIGSDQSGEIIRDICQRESINLIALECTSRPTTLKTRILSTNQASTLSNAGTSSVQQILRIDKLSHQPLSDSETEELKSLIDLHISKESASDQAILLSDYSLGVLNRQTIDFIFEQSTHKVITDPSSNFSSFDRAATITPNQPDLQRELNHQNLDLNHQDNIQTLHKRLLRHLPQTSSFLITRGSEGMLMLSREGEYLSIPAFNKAEVFDVSGAGDTVAACFSVCQAGGLDIWTSAILSNLAASLVVRKAGAATTDLLEMTDALEKIPKLNLNVNELKSTEEVK